jgi:hypothetical protein
VRIDLGTLARWPERSRHSRRPRRKRR